MELYKEEIKRITQKILTDGKSGDGKEIHKAIIFSLIDAGISYNRISKLMGVHLATLRKYRADRGSND